MPRRPVLLGIGAATLIVVGILYAANRAILPQEFQASYAAGSRIALEVSTLSKEFTKNLEAIAAEDARGNYTGALDLVGGELGRAVEVRKKLIDLLRELQSMAASLPNVRSEEAQRFGIQAISAQTSLVSYLVNYNDSLVQLLENLRFKFLSDDPGVYEARTREILEKMNEDVRTINRLNDEYQELIQRFDATVRR